MREISCNAIISSIKEMCIQATHYLSDDMKSALYKGVEKEESPLGRQIFGAVMRKFDDCRGRYDPNLSGYGAWLLFLLKSGRKYILRMVVLRMPSMRGQTGIY